LFVVFFFLLLQYGPEATYVGPGDLHDPKFDHLKETTKLTDLTKSDIYSGLPVSMGSCETWIALYPSSDLEEVYQTNNPQMFCIVTVSIFFFTSLIFILYDCWVESRQRRLLQVAEQSSAILSSLFPSNVRDRLFPTESQHDKSSTTGGRHAFQPIKTRLKSYLENDTAGTNTNQSNSPIADFFPESTVLFADISGFTAWSSMREPTQVFILLESLYGEFDKNADRRGVFKVETIGDSYVAVTGVPEARKDHALVMTKFANDCRTSMISVTERLESTLGPDTGDLKVCGKRFCLF
jgi:Adenylate and Guanylate cyclase catalytic domain